MFCKKFPKKKTHFFVTSVALFFLAELCCGSLHPLFFTTFFWCVYTSHFFFLVCFCTPFIVGVFYTPLTKTDKDTMSLNIFDNIIEELYTLYKEQDGDIDKLFTELTDGDVTEILLTVNATVIFNDKKNASTVIKL